MQTASGQTSDPATVDFPIFYVKRYSVPTQAATQAPSQDLRMLRFAIPSADLFMRSRASPSGIESNVTARITGTGTATAKNYDIKDVSASPDGTTIVFAMRGPLTANMQQNKAPSWRIWQYVIATDTLSLVVNPDTDPDPATVNDVAPQFLPDGRIVFSSTRQRQSEAILLDEGKPQFIAQDEANTEPAFVLHVMNGDGTNIHQISFNQSHDRDPTVLANGRVMWTRWDDAPGKDGMHLYSSNPDGTDMQLLYGANSHATGTTADGLNNSVIQFVKTHEMQDGRILALVRPFAYANVNDTGGDLIIIDTTDYVENTQPAVAGAAASGPAQTLATTNPVLTVPGPSPGGRFYSGFPLWDGTGRILASWTQCRILNTSVTPNTATACTPATLADPNAKSAPPVYSVWMFDPAANTLQPIMQPADGVMITDLVAAQPRTLPSEIVDQQPGVTLDQDMANAGVGAIDIRSVYDFDGVDTAKPSTTGVANPAVTAPDLRLARFIRLEKAVSIPDPQTLKLDAAAFGATNDMREILGYAPVQPDGSVVIQVPAYVAFQISILDATGKRISPVHDAWLQVTPGETVHCNGCHTPAAQQTPLPGQTAVSHGRAGAFASAYAGGNASIPFTNSMASYTTNTGGTEPLVPTLGGQTMAETLSAASCAGDTPHCLQNIPSVNLIYSDVWTNPSAAPLGTPIALSYDSTLTTNINWQIPTAANCLIAWSSTCRIILNYNEQIQPLWTVSRTYAGGVAAGQTGACTMCHGPTSAAAAPQVPAGVTQLDLTNNPSNEEPLQPVSYRRLLFAHDEQQLMMGVLTDVTVPGPIDPTTGLPTQVPVTIGPPMNAGNARGSTQFFQDFATGGTHAGYLSPAELRVISEWLDIGAQYFNNPFDPAAPLD
ncbi:MAG TPA: hypothetical protein VHW25_13830 [Steroidobacteraceae bacterium]|nr:hypothetical protein [Steroidobacteraceae bacterium]